MKVLMLCHDRQIDRRIMVQVQTLIRLGHSVTLLALPLPGLSEAQQSEERKNFWLFRLGLSEILKAQSPIFSKWRLDKALNWFLPKIYQFPRLFRLLLKIYRFKPKMWAHIKLYFGGSPSLVMNAIFNFKSSFVQEGLKHDVDLIQVHDLPLLEAGVELAKSKQCPLIYDAHELFAEQKIYSPSTARAFIEHERQYIQACDVVLTVNESIAREMSSRYSIKKPQVIINALDLPADFDQGNHSQCLRKYFSLSPETKIVLMQGGLSPHRNLENLVHAFLHVKTLDAVLVVMGSGILEKKLQKMAKKLKLYHSKVYFLPAVPQEELLYYTASADLGVIPYPPIDLNTKYCTPNKLFEFIQAGLPILANDLPELRRFVQDTNFGMVHEMNHPKAIAAGIDKAFARLGEQSWRANILEKRHDYSWQAQSKIYVQAIEDLMV